MDPITTAMTAALVAAASAGVTDLGRKAVLDAYEGLKRLVKARLGHRPDVTEALAKLEEAPDSPSRARALSAAVVASGAADDAELVNAARTLLERATAHGGTSAVQIAVGTNNVQAMHGSASVHLGTREKT